MVRLDEIFEIKYGNQFDLSKMELSNDSNGIHFISRDSNNNGCVAFVKKYNDIEPFEPGLITVTMGGSYLLSSFVQVHDFYTAQNIKVLKPKAEMSLEEKLLYCAIIQHNRFRFHSHAREANSTFNSILVPTIDELKNKFDLRGIDKGFFPISPLSSKRLLLNTKGWRWFKLGDLFDVSAGKYHYTSEYEMGFTPYISATILNNGIGKRINLSPEFQEGSITIEKVKCTSFYQEEPFCATSDINVLSHKHPLNKYIGIFLTTIINFNEDYRWSYGRQCRVSDTKNIKIKLPAILNANGEYEPDWQWMEDYIKGLPYSGCL